MVSAARARSAALLFAFINQALLPFTPLTGHVVKNVHSRRVFVNRHCAGTGISVQLRSCASAARSAACRSPNCASDSAALAPATLTPTPAIQLLHPPWAGSPRSSAGAGSE